MPNTTYNRLDDNGLLYLLTLLKGEISSSGEENVIETVKVNGTALVPDANKAVNVEVPTKTSELTNDADFAIIASSTDISQDFGDVLLQDKDGNLVEFYTDPPNDVLNVSFANDEGEEIVLAIPTKDYVDGEITTTQGLIPTQGSAQNPNGYATYNEMSAGISSVAQRVTNVEAVIPNDATPVNPLATMAQVDDITGLIPASASPSNMLATDNGVQTAIDNAIAGITGIEYQVVQNLPAAGEKGVIYLLANSGTAPNVYDEYIWIDGDPTGSYEKIGTTAVDLSGYVQASEMHALTNAEIDTIFQQVFGS